MSTESLVRMANDIAAFFASEPDRGVAADAVASHLRRLWAPRMREQIRAHLAAGGEGLCDLAREAVARLDAPGAGA